MPDATFEKLRALALSFPILSSAHVSQSVNLAELLAELRRALRGGLGRGGIHAARFCLHVFNSANPFNLCEAVGTWDCMNLRAFKAWAVNPFTL